MSRASWRNYVSQQPSLNIQVTRNPLSAAFTHPGFNFTSFNNKGMVDIVNLLSYLVDVRILTEQYPYKEDEEKFFHWGEFRQSHLIFVSSFGLVLSRKMHDRMVPKWPLEAKVTLGYVGNASVAIQTELYAPGWQDPLATKIIQMVVVDKQTRKPKPFSESFKNTYKDQCSMKAGLRFEKFPRPKNTFVYRREIFFMETDKNQHTNFASYVKFALDGVHLALRHQAVNESTSITSSPHPISVFDKPSTGQDNSYRADLSHSLSHLKSLPGDSSSVIDGLPSREADANISSLWGVTKDAVNEGLKSLEVFYVSECVEGDIVDVHIWQEEFESYTVRCSIEKGSKLICQIVLEYFSPLAKL